MKMTQKLYHVIIGPHIEAYWLVHFCTGTEAIQALWSTVTIPFFSLNIPANLNVSCMHNNFWV